MGSKQSTTFVDDISSDDDDMIEFVEQYYDEFYSFDKIHNKEENTQHKFEQTRFLSRFLCLKYRFKRVC